MPNLGIKTNDKNKDDRSISVPKKNLMSTAMSYFKSSSNNYDNYIDNNKDQLKSNSKV